MLSDVTSDQHDYPQCEHCGASLAGRFTPCTECGARPVDSLGVRRTPPPPLKMPLGDPQPMLATRLMTPRIWRPSSRELTDPYSVTSEAPVTAPVVHRLRQSVVLGVSMLVVASAVYLGFIHTNDSDDGTPIAVSGKVKTQHIKPPVALAQRSAPVFVAQRPVKPAPVRSLAVAPTAAPPPAPRRVMTASAEAKHNPGGQTNNPPVKPGVDASKQIRSARANLQQNNLSATKARLAAAMAAQPDNPDALRMRETVTAREQQRDALLSVARGCGYVARWACVWHKAGDALQVDSSSKEAQRLLTLAMRESELASAWPSTPAPETTSDDRSSAISHH
ncbi:hypothetical protein [Paraburkholderia nemoris]|uniref:Zinc ribbon domain-containing protein n=1 Tax=Paraburkholderia nemoris TaxID=2793076 RepID=A0ABN7NBU0_9BURK|nr:MULTISPECIES: hypothetical protein [Paraburkholderia]MBK3816043.1 hypothetical protein [Paraburkholderia aspalathi]CAE6735311.1 hypothetical protein R75777_02249 [Paraburkholderia nemoris]CAE6853432.1 hypothetical protein R69776_07618 [Paraburkholderia nemoris]